LFSSQGFFCSSGAVDGGFYRDCPNGEIVLYDTKNYNWGCRADEGQCPGFGGLRMLCREDDPIVPDELL